MRSSLFLPVMDLATLFNHLEQSLEYYIEQEQVPNQGLLALRAYALINQLTIANGAIQTTPGNLPTAIYADQVTLGATGTALGSQPLLNGVTLTALSTNTSSVFVGPSGVTSGTGLELKPGVSVTLSVSNLDLVYAVGTAGEKVSYLAS